MVSSFDKKGKFLRVRLKLLNRLTHQPHITGLFPVVTRPVTAVMRTKATLRNVFNVCNDVRPGPMHIVKLLYLYLAKTPKSIHPSFPVRSIQGARHPFSHSHPWSVRCLQLPPFPTCPSVHVPYFGRYMAQPLGGEQEMMATGDLSAVAFK